ncbi:isoleucine--tRNA ligase [Rosistilla oblonga]|uniref:isoleucine--tRNA ligase n=1 Tax=Rosistilla oblonga TaxID=2527990 RepID=UPI003A97618D
MFKAVSTDVNFPAQEQQILEFWDQNQIYQESLKLRKDAPAFVFYEGPPTANGMPHPGHCLTRAIKDLFPRYRTMRGYLCERKAGWDTHGLPVEVEVGKELGIHSKEQIEAYGVEPFIQKCQQSVWRYMQEWEHLTRRLGFWVDLQKAYVTYHQSYVESVWWSLKNFFDRGLLYKGHKIVWWWSQGGTALSAGEVGQGYRQVADPSVYVRFPLVDDPSTSLLVWTTTPWTLPSNMFAAVHPELEYALVKDADSDQQFYVASQLVETIADKAKLTLEVVSTCKGTDLIGKRYTPPFDIYSKQLADAEGTLADGSGKQHLYWRVVAADFVTTDSGTGLVHQAPAFGEVDYDVLAQQQTRFADGQAPELLYCVGPDGKFTAAFPEFEGQWVKDADKAISRDLKDRGLLLHQEQYLHDYPFCWRADQDPLIQYPRESWFVRTTEFKDAMLANNQKINWLPGHIKEGRFGNFLESNVDWALSRERYWGTPLPIWVCDETGQMEAIGCYDELLAKPGITGTEVWAEAKAKNPELVDDLRVHKPYIDEVSYDSPFAAGSRMRRVTEVIDCWYDSGAMPFAQWGYPHQNADEFKSQFPADFISEALDQTRGWFYSQLAISTLLNAGDPKHPVDYPHPFKNCIVLGLMLAEWYEDKKDPSKRYLSEDEARQACGDKGFNKKTGKMSKQLRNYRSPNEIFDQYGADALRWYFFANQAPWNSIIYSERTIKESIPEFLLRLWNVFSFFSIYAEIDGFDPTAGIDSVDQLSPSELASANGYRDVSERAEIDRWILSELHRNVAIVVQRMDAYDNYAACQAINELVDGLSNWFVRRSRDRFWAADKQDQNKLDAYWTLYEVLLEVSKVIAPFVPFLAETLWQNLTAPFTESAASASVGTPRKSVHLCDYPTANEDYIDETLSQRMSLLREIASLGRSARANAKLKVRQPLACVEVVLADNSHQAWLEMHDALLREELNVKQVNYTTEADKYVTYNVQPNFKRLGPRVGKLIPQVKQLLGKADGGQMMAQMQADGKVTIEVGDTPIDLDSDDIQISLTARDGWTAAQGRGCVVVLSTDLTPELVREGMARDLVRFVQERRKGMDLQFTDRIRVGVETDSEEVRQAIQENNAFICEETLAEDLALASLPETESVAGTLGDFEVQFYVTLAGK